MAKVFGSRPWRAGSPDGGGAFARAALAGVLMVLPATARAGDPSADPPRARVMHLIRQTAVCRGVDPDFAVALARAESGLDWRAVSAKGARGLFQLLPATAREMGVLERDIFDPLANTDAGLRYFRLQAERFDNIALALVAYNAGPEVAARWTRDPTTFIARETRRFVDRVFAIYRRLKRTRSAPSRAAPEACSPLPMRRLH